MQFFVYVVEFKSAFIIDLISLTEWFLVVCLRIHQLTGFGVLVFSWHDLSFYCMVPHISDWKVNETVPYYENCMPIPNNYTLISQPKEHQILLIILYRVVMKNVSSIWYINLFYFSFVNFCGEFTSEF